MKTKLLSICSLFLSYGALNAQTFGWATSTGSLGHDLGRAITLDATGNVISSGTFSGTVDFNPAAAGTQTLVSVSGSNDMFITKTDAAGNYIWSRAIGGPTNYDFINALATDAAGNVYATGYFGGTADFDPSPTGTYTLASSGGQDAFVCKLDAAGNFVWAAAFGGGSNADYGNGIVIDASGNVYCTGAFVQTADFNPSPTVANTLTSVNGSDVYICKLTSAGAYVWAKRLGGGGGTDGRAIAVDGTGNVYTTGIFNGTADFDPSTSAVSNLVSNGTQDIFISKLDASGDFVWVKQIGGIGGDRSNAIALDAAGANVYVAGNFNDVVDFDPSITASHTFSSTGGSDIFIEKLDAAGNFVWAKQIGDVGSGNYDGASIVVNTAGSLFLAGSFYMTADFDPSPAGTYTMSSRGGVDGFVLKLDATGNFAWARQIGGSSYDVSNCVAADVADNVYTIGSFYATVDFDPSPATYTLTSAGLYDAYVLKLKVQETVSVGLDELNAGVMAGVYPNPNNGSFTINTSVFDNVKAEMYNATGGKIMSITLENNMTQVSTDHLSDGIYYLNLLRNNVPVYQSKIIKTR